MLMQKLKKLKSGYKRTSDLNALNFGGKQNQFYLTSYPKSGNTWIRILFSNLLSGSTQGTFLADLKTYIPDSHFKDHLEYVRNPDSEFHALPFQFIKTHDPFSKHYRNKNVIYICRDGRDVLNSYYHYLNARRETPLKIDELISGKSGAGFGTWSDHIINWYKNQTSRFFILKYENLKNDTFSEISKLLSAINWDIDEEVLKNAIKNASFKKLQNLEKEKGVVYKEKLKKKESLFFRKGEVGGWKNTFLEKDMELFWEHQGAGMRLMGYEK
jgi:Sulfotransferase domain